MTYQVKPDPNVEEIFKKLAKKDRVHFNQITNKLREIAENPELGKPLRNVMKGTRRLHIGNFVLIYSIDEKKNLIRLLDYDHHDNVY